MDVRPARPSVERRDALPWVWGATAQEAATTYPCDRLAHRQADTTTTKGQARAVRAVSVAASPDRVFAWLGNLRAAPYSYDWADNFGRRSPRRLMPELGALEAGQRVMTIFTAVDVVPGSTLTLAIRPGLARRVFGDLWVTYAVRPAGAGSRLVAVLCFGSAGAHISGRGRSHLAQLIARVGQYLLAWGDLAMMRKQLHTLRGLAEECS